MNKSSFKSDLTKLLNNFSETSNDFLSEINQNLKKNNLYGGSHSCPCMDALKAFNAENYDLGLYILNDKNCCMCCKDENGNTLLHHIVLCCTVHNNNGKCLSALTDTLTRPDVKQFINIQNSEGTTPILLAVENENEFVANKLDEAGADKTLADNSGNYLQTDDVPEASSVNMSETPNEKVCINNVVNLMIGDKKPEPELTSLNLTSIADNSSNIASITPNTDIQRDAVLRAFNAKPVTDDLSSLGLTSSDNYLDSDKFIQFLSNKYQKAPPKSIDELMGETETESSVHTDGLLDVLTKKLSKNTEAIPVVLSDSVNTDILMDAIDNIKTTNKSVAMEGKPLEGGAKEKLMGYRKINLHSENSDNIYERINENISRELKTSKMSKYSKQSNETSINLDLYYSDGESGSSNNELSRLINSRKNELHNEVINMIMGMLNNGKITRNSKPIEATENNAKLIKSFLYRIVSEKNPQLTGMDKILMIKKMNEKEILDMLKKLPDLDELAETIRKHIELKHKDRKEESDKKTSKKSKNSKTSDKSETPKKKSKKSVEQSRAKKTSKKSSKQSSKKSSKKPSKRR